MKTKSKISGYIVRSASIAVLFSCAIVGFSSAFNSPGRWSGLLARSTVPGGGVKSAPTQLSSQLTTRGLWVQIETRGWPSGFWPGQLIQQFNDYDPVVGHTVSEEAALQLDAMHAMGVNTITIELRSCDTDGNHNFPICHIGPPLGFQWPQPTTTELANLPLYFDLAQSKGIKIILVLVNTHTEEQPPTNSETWLSAILNVVRNHPALDFVVFNGGAKYGTDCDGVPVSCGGQAEPGLWTGRTTTDAVYVSWAISYAMSLGMPSTKLSAGAIVGDFFTVSEPPNCLATDGHLWPPIVVMKQIFDNLGIPNNQRLYALSYYEHRKCSTAQGLPCVDASPSIWADQTLQNEVFSTIGWSSGARVVAYEMGEGGPVEPSWTTSQAIQDIASLMARYRIDGGSFWRWTSFENSEDPDPTLAEPIKRRGVEFNYTPAKEVLECYYTGACPLPTPIPAFLGNISTRAFVQTGDNVMIGGFIVQGTGTKRVMIRAIGPELSQYGVPDPLQDPTLELHDGNGTLIASNNNWQTTIIGGIIASDQVSDIQISQKAPGDSRESAIIADLPPGNYTAIVRGVTNTTGVALVEVYDFGAGATSVLDNISTRSFVQTGDNVMIGGFIVQGTGTKRVIIRAIGPELSQYGVPNPLADPTLELHDGTGTLIASNNNWQTTIIGGVITQDQVQDITNSGHAPGHPLESAIIADLPAGNYTAIVRGFNNTTGVALVEVYNLSGGQ